MQHTLRHLTRRFLATATTAAPRRCARGASLWRGSPARLVGRCGAWRGASVRWSSSSSASSSRSSPTSLRPLRAECICVGSEILSGDIVDTNSKFLAQQLPRLGFQLQHTHHVPDDLDVIASSVALARERSDAVFVVGGLGPTVDDVTREAVARSVGEDAQLVVDGELEQRLLHFFKLRGKEMTENNLKQAQLIPSAQPLANPRGTAPGWAIDAHALRGEHAAVYVLPGPPAEMEYMFEREVEPRLVHSLDAAGKVPPRAVSRVVKTLGLGESEAEHMLEDVINGLGDVEFGIYHKVDGIHLKLTAVTDSPEASEALVKEAQARVEAVVGKWIWGYDDEQMEDSLARELVNRGITLSVAETYTGGLLGHTLSNATDYQRFFAGGVISPPNANKVLHQSVTSEYLAQETLSTFDSDLALGLSDVYQGQEGEGSERPAGSTYISLAFRDGRPVMTRHYVYLQDRIRTKHRAVSTAISMVREALLGSDSNEQ